MDIALTNNRKNISKIIWCVLYARLYNMRVYLSLWARVLLFPLYIFHLMSDWVTYGESESAWRDGVHSLSSLFAIYRCFVLLLFALQYSFEKEEFWAAINELEIIYKQKAYDGWLVFYLRALQIHRRWDEEWDTKKEQKSNQLNWCYFFASHEGLTENSYYHRQKKKISLHESWIRVK